MEFANKIADEIFQHLPTLSALLRPVFFFWGFSPDEIRIQARCLAGYFAYHLWLSNSLGGGHRGLFFSKIFWPTNRHQKLEELMGAVGILEKNLLGTNISPEKAILKNIEDYFPFPKVGYMLVPWRVHHFQEKMAHELNRTLCFR